MSGEISHRWNVHFDRLSEYQHAAIALPFASPQIVSGRAGSGRSTVAAFRTAALLQAGPSVSRPRPTVLSTSVLRSRRMGYLLGPLSAGVDLMTISEWLVRRFETLTGERAPAPSEVDWIQLGLAVASTGTAPARSVVLDDAHHVRDEQLMALRLLTSDLFVTTHGHSARSVAVATGITPGASLERRRRQPREMLFVAAAWGDGPLTTEREGSHRLGILDVGARSGRTVVEGALMRYREDRGLRIAIAPMTPQHVGKIADLLLHLGLGRSRLFSTDVPYSVIRRWDVGAPGIYVLQPGQLEGLEFDDVAVTGLEQLTDDVSEAPVRRRLLAATNATTRRLGLHWSGASGRKPSAIGVLQSAGVLP